MFDQGPVVVAFENLPPSEVSQIISSEFKCVCSAAKLGNID
jgi:hypothetical protein